MSTLARHSLVVDSDDKEGGGLSMHAMTQEVVRDLLMGNFAASLLGGVLEALGGLMAKFKMDQSSTFKVGRRYARHVKAASSYARTGEVHADGSCFPGLATLCLTTGHFFHYVACAYSDALAMHETELSASVAMLGSDDVRAAIAYGNIGNVLIAQGKYPEALERYEKCVAIEISTYGTDHISVSDSYDNMGAIYGMMGKHSESLPLFEKGLAIRSKALGFNSLPVSSSFMNLGMFHSKLGKYSEALELFEKSLAIRITLLGSSHLSVASMYENIGGVHSQQGRPEEAQKVWEKGLDILIEVRISR